MRRLPSAVVAVVAGAAGAARRHSGIPQPQAAQ